MYNQNPNPSVTQGATRELSVVERRLVDALKAATRGGNPQADVDLADALNDWLVEQGSEHFVTDTEDVP